MSRIRWFSVFAGRAGVLAAAVVLAGAPAPAQTPQLNPDKAALLVLQSARRAYNERNYPFAVQRFGEFLRVRGGHAEAPSARYGLALSLLALPQKDYNAVVQALQPVVSRAGFPDRPFAFYYMAVARRGMGEQALALAVAKPQEAPHHRNVAAQNFAEAAKSFSAAAGAFAARVKKLPAAKKTAEIEWAARAHCDHREMLLRLKQFTEAQKGAKAFLADPALGKSRYRALAQYHLGCAHFGLGEHLQAGRALSRLAPFQQEFGVHARYLLGRTHHLAGERPESAAQYQAVLSEHQQRVKAAQAALRTPAALKPPQRAALEALVRGPPPDYLVRSSFYLALLLLEQGRAAEALAGFTALIQKHPKSSLVPEAQLRQGYCQMQLRKFPEAIKTLQPLCQHPLLSDRALWWVGRAQIAGADPKNAPAYRQALAAGINALGQAAGRAAQLAQSDPDAKLRRGDILLEVGDTQQLAGQHRQAVATYQLVINEKPSPDQVEQAMQRQVTAMHLAGAYKESDDLCTRFEKTYPTSTLLAAVWFRSAENAYRTAMAAAANANLPNRRQELNRLFGEAIRRYQRLLGRFPDFSCAGLARHGMATAQYQLGRFREAAATWAAIPQTDRVGELSTVPYLTADCLIRTLPGGAGDALQAARLVKQSAEAAKLLEAFLGAHGKSPEAPDALLKLGHCYQRMAAVSADPAKRKETLTLAKGAYDRFMQQFGRDPSHPTALFEQARCQALLGDPNGAANQLRRFRADPLRASTVAPLAMIRLSTLLRSQNKAAEAAGALGQFRTQYEAALLNDPARKGWVPQLQYEHALAVKESGKLPEARAMFEALAKQFADRPEALNAAWRAAQCRREELAAQLAAASKALDAPGAKPQDVAAAEQSVRGVLKGLRETVESLQARVEALDRQVAGSDCHLRLLYEAAWCYRALGDAEIEIARRRLRREALAEVRGRLAKQMPPGQAPPVLRGPDIPLSAIPTRLAERGARDQYERLIAAAGGRRAGAQAPPLALQARLELCEFLARRARDPAALREAAALLSEALAKNPPGELARQIRLRLAAVLLAGNDPRAALVHAEAVARDPAGPFVPHARFLAAEALFRQQDWAKAIKHLLPFRDHPPFQRVPDLSDRALLRLGQAYARAGQWNPSRQALSVLVQRFPQSRWVEEAWYAIGESWQSQKQYDQAVNAYAQVTARTAAEVAAKAQLQMGLCRLEQKRYAEAGKCLLAAAFTYDYPECSAQARCEAGRAHLGMKQPAEAARLWRRVIRDHPASRWAQVARTRLAAIEAAKP